jgi:hypothetical protein
MTHTHQISTEFARQEGAANGDDFWGPPDPKSIAPMARRGGSKRTPNKQSSARHGDCAGVMHNDLIR